MEKVCGSECCATNLLLTMDTVIEQQRKLLEERERVEDALVKEKMLKKASVSGNII